MAAELMPALGFLVKTATLGILLCGIFAAFPLQAETFEGCSWAGPDPDWLLDRTLPTVDFVGSLRSVVRELLHEAGIPISFISRAAEDPEVRFQRSEATTIRELLDEVMAQTPGYRLDVVNGKLVIYPLDEGYDALLDLGDLREVSRTAAFLAVLGEINSKIPALRRLGTVFRGPFGGLWRELISVGGVRTVVEHLASLTAGGPGNTFMVAPGARGKIYLDLGWTGMIEEILLEAPRKVEVGAEFQVVPRVILADGTTVTLIGSRCSVDYHPSDESILKFDQGGRAVAISKGTAGVTAIYEAKAVHIEVEVTDD